jgi:hypothetical protein
MARGSSVFWRVEDAGSQARTVHRRGVLTREWHDEKLDFGDRYGSKRNKLAWSLQEHFDWGSTCSSPYISVYSDKRTAEKEAERRVREGRRDVTITKIDVSEPKEEVQYRNARKLARRLDCWIPERAWHNSEHEWLFLHHIPRWAVVSCDPFC